jgi:hypothetical protein
MAKFLSFTLLLILFGCQNQNEKNSIKNPLKDKTSNELIKDTTWDKSISFSKELVGDSILCSMYSLMAPLNKIVFDTMDHNPLKNIKIIASLNFERTIEVCMKGNEDVYSRKLKLENGIVIEFMEDNTDSKNAFITVVNHKLFSIKKLLGEMFDKESEIYFHYDTGKMYKLSDGNILFVEQPESWNGEANSFDCYQYFDLKKKEITQFIEKDNFINGLK